MLFYKTVAPVARRHLSWSLGLLVLAITAVIFHPVIYHDFVVWDDDYHVYDNPFFQPLTWSNVVALWQAPYLQLYIPLTYTAWAGLVWLTQAVAGVPRSATLFHQVNLLLHLGNTLLVYRLALLILPQEKRRSVHNLGAAAMAALLFGLHPLQVEAVAWVSGLKDVFSGCWALLALWQYLLCVRATRPIHRWGHYGCATVAFILALLAKPAAVVVPILAWLLATSGLGQARKPATFALLSWCILAAGWGILTKYQQPDTAISTMVAWWERPIIAADALAFYLGKLLWPLHLGPDYGRSPQAVLGQLWPYPASLLTLCLGVLWWWKQRYFRALHLAAAVFVGGLLPVLGWVPFFFQGYSTVADRYVYLAFVGPALALGTGLSRLGAWRSVWVASGCALGVFSWLSAGQIQVWQNTLSLFTHALQVNPRSALAHEKLATALTQQRRYTEALAHYRQALELRPHYPTVHNNLGKLFAQQGNLEAAVQHYTEALRQQPQHDLFHTNLGSVLASQGQLDAAIAHYVTALQLNPHAAQAHYNLGNALVRQGQREAALSHYMAALRLRPAWAEAHNNLGSTLDDQGRHAEAIGHYQEALRLNPDLAEAYNNLGDAWLDQGRIAEAIAAFQAAVRLQPTWAEAHYNLGGAFVRAKQWQAAVSAYRAALRWHPGWPLAARSLASLFVMQAPLSPAVANEVIAFGEQVCQASIPCAEHSWRGAHAACEPAKTESPPPVWQGQDDAQRLDCEHDVTVLCALAAAYGAIGQETRARQIASRCLHLAAVSGNTTLVTHLKTHLPFVSPTEATDVPP